MPPIRVLIIEDEESTAFLIAELISYSDMNKYIVSIASSLEEGLEKIAHEGIEVVLLDLGLPGLEGTKALTITRREFPNLPIVVLTGKSTPGIAGETAREGALYFMQKTDANRPDTLTNAIEFVTEGQKRINALQETRDKIQLASVELSETSAIIKKITGASDGQQRERSSP